MLQGGGKCGLRVGKIAGLASWGVQLGIGNGVGRVPRVPLSAGWAEIKLFLCGWP